MRLSFTALFLAITIASIYGQIDCDPYLTSQEDIDNYAINNPDCSMLYSLTIDGEDITNLNGLSGINSCFNLTIRNTSLVDLSGLESLVEVYSENSFEFGQPGIYILDNVLLENLNGLNNLKKTSNLIISGNSILENTNALNITTFEKFENDYGREDGNRIVITDNPLLTNIVGLPGLQTSTVINIKNNNSLTDLSGFSNLSSLCRQISLSFFDGAINIENNDALTSLSGLGNFSICGNLTIRDNDQLKDLSGLQTISVSGLKVENNVSMTEFGDLSLNLERDNYDGTRLLEILNNTSLKSIELAAFNDLDDYSLNQLYTSISDNDSLSICNVAYLCALINLYPDNVEILNNATGCNNTYEVADQCGYELFGGLVFYDENCNSLSDPLDFNIPYLTIRNTLTGNPVAQTNAIGEYFFTTLSSGMQDLALAPDSIIGYSYHPESFEIAFSTALVSTDTLDFSLCADSLFTNLTADLSGINPPRPGFLNGYKICVSNQGSLIEEGEINFSFIDPELSMYISYEELDGATVNGLDLDWQFSDLGIFETTCYNIVISVSTDTPLGTEFNSKLVVNSNINSNDAYPDDNCDSLTQVVVGSFDPNDKMVFPSNLDLEKLDDSNHFEYQIRFQNTGTANAETVVIIDTIPPTLDMSSFKMESASHPYSLSFERNNVVRWKFENIQLPPEQDDAIGSNGFVKFRINNRAGLDPSEKIKNRASIYFDFNEPIVTEYAEVNYTSDYEDLSVAVDFDFITCNLLNYNIAVTNNTPNTSSTQLKLYISNENISGLFQYTETDQAMVVGDTLIWDIEDIGALETKMYSIVLELDSGFTDGENLVVMTTISDDDDLSNNENSIVRGLWTVDDLTLTTQAEVDASNCICKVHNMYIEEGVDITSLNGFNKLKEVSWSLTIEDNPNLLSINGFENLKNARRINIVDNDNLLSINGFNSLEETNGLYINSNAVLNSIEAFEMLQSPSDFKLEIEENNQLMSISGFNELKNIDRLKISNSRLFDLNDFESIESINYLKIAQNAQLSSIEALHRLTELSQGLLIFWNGNLESLNGLQNLQSIGKAATVGGLRIERNEKIQNLDELANVTNIKELVSILNNASLSSIDSLDASFDDLEILKIQDNPFLNLCNTIYVCKILEEDSIESTIGDNDSGCNSIAEVEIACTTSTEDSNIENSFDIYPNPVSDKIYIHYNGKGQSYFDVKFSGIDGTLMYENQDLNLKNQNIDVAHLPNGIYLLTLQSEEGYYVKKIVVGN